MEIIQCPRCKSADVLEYDETFECNDCSKTWDKDIDEIPFSDIDEEGEEEILNEIVEEFENMEVLR